MPFGRPIKQGRNGVHLHAFGMQSSPELVPGSRGVVLETMATRAGSHLYSAFHHDGVNAGPAQAINPSLVATTPTKSSVNVDASDAPTSASANRCIHCMHQTTGKHRQRHTDKDSPTSGSLANDVDVETQDGLPKPRQSWTMRRLRKIWPLAGATVGLASLGLHIAELVAALN